MAVLPARIHALEHDDLPASLSGIVHHSCCTRAESGSAQPRRSSSCAKVRTTLSAYRFTRYSWSDAYLLGTFAALPGALPLFRSAAGASDVFTCCAINACRLIHFHIRVPAHYPSTNTADRGHREVNSIRSC